MQTITNVSDCCRKVIVSKQIGIEIRMRCWHPRSYSYEMELGQILNGQVSPSKMVLSDRFGIFDVDTMDPSRPDVPPKPLSKCPSRETIRSQPQALFLLSMKPSQSQACVSLTRTGRKDLCFSLSCSFTWVCNNLTMPKSYLTPLPTSQNAF